MAKNRSIYDSLRKGKKPDYMQRLHHQNRKTEVFYNKNRKTDPKNSQNRKTENPHAPLCDCTFKIYFPLVCYL